MRRCPMQELSLISPGFYAFKTLPCKGHSPLAAALSQNVGATLSLTINCIVKDLKSSHNRNFRTVFGDCRITLATGQLQIMQRDENL